MKLLLEDYLMRTNSNTNKNRPLSWRNSEQKINVLKQEIAYNPYNYEIQYLSSDVTRTVASLFFRL